PPVRPEKGLVMHSAEGGVVDDALGTRHERAEATEALHRHPGLSALLGYPLDVQMIRPRTSSDRAATSTKLRAVRRLPGPLEVQVRIRLVRHLLNLPGLLVDPLLPEPALVTTTLPPASSIRLRCRWVNDPGPSGSMSPSSRASPAASSRRPVRSGS